MKNEKITEMKSELHKVSKEKAEVATYQPKEKKT